MSDRRSTQAGERELVEVERRNEQIARAFMRDWSARDAGLLLGYLEDDVEYQVYEGGPVRRGKEEVRESLERFFTRWRRVEFIVERLNVIGPIVVNERREEYDGIEGQQDWRFHVASVFVIQHGRITHWRDYSLPGKKQVFGPYDEPA